MGARDRTETPAWRMSGARRLRMVFAGVAVMALCSCASNSAGTRSEPTQGCLDAFGTAAAVSDLNNDAELTATLAACEDVDDWVLSLQQNPGAGSLTSYTRDDALDLLGIVCAVDEGGSKLCASAAEDGLIDS